ncbi:hypothetical protein PbJCM13498_28790 [Prolixibacter bellariivorans]|uniref:histidine kinase n=1 Tax=Prolixibacter bellariivorans TaxID=314319 RepID=A0A5M4B2A0_9BACT|nr:PAS domain S-box protein [Prolixibacter bellariivorans]GET34016.1 hypothetical protein PbJCM13498_28790 [Prolixibacter bellariivorans]
MLEKWKSFLARSRDPEFLFSGRGELLYCSPSSFHIANLRQVDLPADSDKWLQIIDESDRTKWLTWFEQAFLEPYNPILQKLSITSHSGTSVEYLAASQLISIDDAETNLLRVTLREEHQQPKQQDNNQELLEQIIQLVNQNTSLDRKLNHFLHVVCPRPDIKHLFIYHTQGHTEASVYSCSSDKEQFQVVPEQTRTLTNTWKELLFYIEPDQKKIHLRQSDLPEEQAMKFRNIEIEELYLFPITSHNSQSACLGVVPQVAGKVNEALWEELSRLLSIAWISDSNRKRLIHYKEKLDWMLDTTGQWYWEYNPSKAKFVIDRHWMIKCGYTENHLPKEDFLRYIHPNNRHEFVKLLDIPSEARNHVFETDFRFQKANGEYQSITCKGKTMFSHHSGQPRIVGVLSEIAQVSSVQERFDQAFQLSPSIMAITQMSTGVILDANQRFLDLLGKTKEEALGLNFFDLRFFSQETQEYLRERLLRDKKFVNEEITINLGDQLKFGLYSASAFMSNGEMLVISSVQDITEQKNISKELKQYRENINELVQQRTSELNNSRHYYETLIQEMTDYVCHSLPDTTILFVNEAYSRYIGQPREVLIGKKWIDFIPEFSLDFIQEQIQTISTKRKVHTFEVYIPALNGQPENWIQWINVPILDENGEISEIQSSGRDITNIKQIQSELSAAKEMAEESGRLKSAFLANISHEIRTPMNVILGFTNLLIDNDLEEDERQEFAGHITNNANLLLRVLDNILEISRMEAGFTDIEKSPCDINKMLESLCQEYAKLAQPGVQVNCCRAIETPVSFMTDKRRMKQLFTNLMDNAVKFTSEGHIECGYRLHPSSHSFNQIEFYVEDTGIGIPAHLIPVIFEPFRQADNSLTRQFGGTGLGLSISKKLAELLGGTLSVNSVPGKKTVFSVTFPFQPSNLKTTNNMVHNITDNKYHFVPDWQQHKVLIVEDVESNYQYIYSVLGKTGIQIIWASDGKEAIEFYRDNPDIDLVLMDIKLPIMNGLDATQTLKSLNPDLPVIAVTAYAMSEDKDKCLEAGCDDFIVKPVNRFELLAKIENYFESQEL